MLQSLSSIDLRNKRVFLRVDFNVPMKHGEIQNTARIDYALPTIRYILDNGGTPVIASHLGRPEGKYSKELSMEPISKYLSTMLSNKMFFVQLDTDNQIRDAVQAAYENNGVVMLENLRCWSGEEANDKEFAKRLVAHVDVYVNEAFSASHRDHASIVGVPSLLKEKAMGILFEREMTEIARFVKSAKSPEVVILGGAKIDTKIGLIERLMKRADTFLIGGALANTFLAAKGYEIGESKADLDKIDTAKKILEELEKADKKVVLPVDAVVRTNNVPMNEVPAHMVKKDMAIYDIGLQTIELFLKEIAQAKTIIWNGPLGYFEKDAYREGTQRVLEALQQSKAETLLGGGDTIAVLDALRIGIDKFTYVSLSGGAMIEYIEHLTLPGIEALER